MHQNIWMDNTACTKNIWMGNTACTKNIWIDNIACTKNIWMDNPACTKNIWIDNTACTKNLNMMNAWLCNWWELWPRLGEAFSLMPFVGGNRFWLMLQNYMCTEVAIGWIFFMHQQLLFGLFIHCVTVQSISHWSSLNKFLDAIASFSSYPGQSARV